MAVKFQDYYKILGLDRTATEKKSDRPTGSWRYHPDLQPKEKQKKRRKI